MLSTMSSWVVGAALALSGATLQSVLGNPLAEPYMLGIVGGAALFAAVALHFGWVVMGSAGLSGVAFLGAAFALVLVCGVAWLAARKRGGKLGETIVLAGFVTGSFTGSMQMVVMSFAEASTFENVQRWLFGNLHAVKGSTLAIAALCLLVAFGLVYHQSRSLNALLLGNIRAVSLGVNVKRVYAIVLGAVSLATAASVALAGAIGFVGLVVPHIVRRFVGGNHRLYLPVSAVVGALVLWGADALGGVISSNLSAGVICAVFGGPFFLILLCFGAQQTKNRG